MIKIENRHDRISVKAKVMGGKPCIKGHAHLGQPDAALSRRRPEHRADLGGFSRPHRKGRARRGGAARLVHLIEHAGADLSGALTVVYERGVRSRPII